MGGNIYPIVPASAAVYWILVPLALVTALLAFTTWSASHTTFLVSPEGLKIRGDIYGRTIPRTSLVVERARVVDLSTDEDLRPGWRTNGVGLPGYKSGWFRLKNGEKALLFVTDQRRVLAVPTTEGYTLLVSAADPDGLLSDLRRVSAGPA